MDAEHRHELKSNELAEGISHLPTLLKDNARTIIGVLLICVAIITWPIFNRMSDQKKMNKEIEITQSIQLLEQDVYNIIRTQQAENASDTEALSTLLLNAESLLDQVSDVDNPNLKALAQIKAAQAYRTELHLRKNVDQQSIEEQISKAKAAYEEAADNAETSTLKAMAQFGLAMCSEELGQFAQAGEIYEAILADESFKATTIYPLAQQRLDSLDENSETFTFTELPKPATPIQMPSDMTSPDVQGFSIDGIQAIPTPVTPDESGPAVVVEEPVVPDTESTE